MVIVSPPTGEPMASPVSSGGSSRSVSSPTSCPRVIRSAATVQSLNSVAQVAATWCPRARSWRRRPGGPAPASRCRPGARRRRGRSDWRRNPRRRPPPCAPSGRARRRLAPPPRARPVPARPRPPSSRRRLSGPARGDRSAAMLRRPAPTSSTGPRRRPGPWPRARGVAGRGPGSTPRSRCCRSPGWPCTARWPSRRRCAAD